MNGFYSHSPGSTDTHLHCVSTLDVKGLEYTFVRTLKGSGKSRPVFLPVPKYHTTCGGDGRPSPEHPESGRDSSDLQR